MRLQEIKFLKDEAEITADCHEYTGHEMLNVLRELERYRKALEEIVSTPSQFGSTMWGIASDALEESE